MKEGWIMDLSKPHHAEKSWKIYSKIGFVLKKLNILIVLEPIAT
jgi:hypothetical protein